MVDITTSTEKETERLDRRNPTLVFEYEKSRDSVDSNFRCVKERNYFRQKYLVEVIKMYRRIKNQNKRLRYKFCLINNMVLKALLYIWFG